MGTYIYGIVISVVMIAAGLSGQFSGGGSGINIPLVAFGAFFLIIDVMMLLRARQGERQAPRVDEVLPARTETAQAEASVEVLASGQEEAGAEAAPKAVDEPAAEMASEAQAEPRAPIEEHASAEIRQ